MKHPKTTILLAMLAVLLGLGAALAWLAGTTSGLRFLADRALPHLPLELDAAELEGRLIGPLRVGAASIETPGLVGQVDGLALDWRPLALLRGRVHVLELGIDTPQLYISTDPAAEPAPPDADPAELPSLPIGIRVDRFQLNDGALWVDGEPVLTGLQVVVAGQASGQRLRLEQVDIRSDQGEIAGRAHASMAKRERWDIDLAWQIVVEEHSLAGRTRASGRLDRLNIVQELTGLADARAEGTIQGLPAAPRWDLELALAPLGSGPWDDVMAGFAAELQLAGELSDSHLAGWLALPAALPQRVDVDLRGGWREGLATLDTGSLVSAGLGRIEASGRVGFDPELAGTFRLEASDFRWPPGEAQPEIEVPALAIDGEGAGERWSAGIEGTLRREGLPDTGLSADLQLDGQRVTVRALQLDAMDESLRAAIRGMVDFSGEQLAYEFEAEARAELADYPALHAELHARGDEAGIDVERLQATLLGGEIEGQGRIAWDGTEGADFTLGFAALDPGQVAPEWPGRLSGRLAVRGLPDAPGGLVLELEGLEGELRTLPVSGRASVNHVGDAWTVRELEIGLGENRLEVSGQWSPDGVLLDARLAAPALETVDPGLSGRISARLRAEGPIDAPRIRLEAEGGRLRWQDTRVRALELDADIDVAGKAASMLRLSAAGVATAPGPGASIRLDGEGFPAEHRLALSLERRRPQQELALTLAGGWVDAAWQGRIETLGLSEEAETIWALEAPASLEVAADRAALGEACMDGTFGRLCIDGRWTAPRTVQGHALLAELDLGPLSEWLGMGLLAKGVVTGEITVEADETGFREMRGGIELTGGHVRLAGEDSPPLLEWAGGSLELEGDEAEARASLSLRLAGDDHVTALVTAGWNEADPPLQGELEAELGELQLLIELLPELAELEGRARASATLAGTLAAPDLRGRFEWRDGAAQVPALGLRPEDINLIARIEDGILDFQASARLGDGELEADGRFDLTQPAVAGQASLRGESLLVANLPEARVTANLDLALDYAGNELKLSGDVVIPFARISGVGGPTAITASPDEVIVGPRARVEEEGLRVTSRVRVSVGPDVQVQAAGLRGRVEGEILTVVQPQALPWGRGELRVVDGTFGAFGQRLEIETGRLLYTGGPLDNPGLDIRAVRKVDEVTAGALVRGTLQHPEISVYSNPPMPRAEALSYLTLGKSLDQLQSGEQTTLNQAAQSLALSGGGLIAQDLGRRLGFDEVSVTADDVTGGAALVVSKYLGGGLYVSYGLGLFDTVNTLRLRYQINQRLSLEATSGEESAADLFYTFERD